MITRWALTVIIALTLSSQTSANDLFIEAYGDSLELSLIQKNGQDNTLDLYISGDSNTADVVQDGNYNTATISLTGPEPTSTTINQTGNNFSTTVTQYCATTGGCSVTVTQY